MKALFSALGAILNVSGQSTFKVTIAGAGAGLLQIEESAGAHERMQALEAAGMSATTVAAGNVRTTLCFGLNMKIFGTAFKLPDSTCLSINSDDVKNMWNTLTRPITDFVKQKAIDIANRYLKDSNGKWDPKGAFDRAMSDLKNFFTNYVKDMAYGRGIGKPISACPSDKEKSGLLCYPKCRSGYHGVGPVCWQSCGGFGRDDGAFCAKPSSYGRGVGRSPCTGCTGCTGCSGCGWRGCSGVLWGAQGALTAAPVGAEATSKATVRTLLSKMPQRIPQRCMLHMLAELPVGNDGYRRLVYKEELRSRHRIATYMRKRRARQ